MNADAYAPASPVEGASREAELVKALEAAIMFIDVTARAMLPREHPSCDSACSHAAYEMDNFNTLDVMAESLRAALRPSAPQEPTESEQP